MYLLWRSEGSKWSPDQIKWSMLTHKLWILFLTLSVKSHSLWCRCSSYLIKSSFCSWEFLKARYNEWYVCGLDIWTLKYTALRDVTAGIHLLLATFDQNMLVNTFWEERITLPSFYMLLKSTQVKEIRKKRFEQQSNPAFPISNWTDIFIADM